MTCAWVGRGSNSQSATRHSSRAIRLDERALLHFGGRTEDGALSAGVFVQELGKRFLFRRFTLA